MNIDPKTLEKLIVPLGFLISGIIIGFIVEKILLINVKKVAIKARWEGGRVIVNSLRGITFLWFIIAGIYLATLNLDLIGPQTFSHLKMALAVIMIFSITIVISKLATGFVKLYTGSILPSTSIFVNLTKVFVFILGMLVLLQTLGISVAPILTALGVGGLAVALALQDTLSNLFAGLHIIASKKIKPGDYIKLESGGEGFLEDITWRNTAIRTLQNNTIIVPNSKMASAITTNFNIPTKEMDIVVPVGVSYESDLNTVEKLIIEVGKQVLEECCPDSSTTDPIVRFSDFADSGINVNTVLRVKEFTDQGLVKSKYIKALHKRFKEENIEIPFPSRTLYVKNGQEIQH